MIYICVVFAIKCPCDMKVKTLISQNCSTNMNTVRDERTTLWF